MSIAKKSKDVVPLDTQARDAFRKASFDVVKKAEQTGTEVVVWHNDGIVKLSPSEAATLLEADAVSSET